MLRELLEAQRNRKSEQLSKDQLSLFETLWKASQPEQAEAEEAPPESTAAEPQQPEEPPAHKRSGRQPLAPQVVRERVVHDLPESEKHCEGCGKDLRQIAQETSERYQCIPAVMKVIEDVRRKYAYDCTIRTADKPAQPIEKSVAGASVLAPVIVSKFADHFPLYRQEKIFARHGLEISCKTMGGWMPAAAGLLAPLYQAAKTVLLASKVIGTDDTGVKVLDPKLSLARTGRIGPYVGDGHPPVVVYDYTATRGRDGPAKFLEGYTGYLQADAYSVYDACFKPTRGLTAVGCMMHMRRYCFKALESDQAHRGPALHLISGLYAVADRAQEFSGEERLKLRQRLSAPVMEKLHPYLLEIRQELLPKSPAAPAVRSTLNQGDALTRYLHEGDLEIDDGAIERGNGTFFGRDNGGKTAAVLLRFIAMCKRNAVEPVAWFRDVLTRIATYPMQRIEELLPHNWKTLATAPQA